MHNHSNYVRLSLCLSRTIKLQLLCSCPSACGSSDAGSDSTRWKNKFALFAWFAAFVSCFTFSRRRRRRHSVSMSSLSACSSFSSFSSCSSSISSSRATARTFPFQNNFIFIDINWTVAVAVAAAARNGKEACGRGAWHLLSCFYEQQNVATLKMRLEWGFYC